MRKDFILNATIDQDAARLLTTLAERETEGNRSAALRRLIREAGERRGWLVPAVAKSEVQHGQPA